MKSHDKKMLIQKRQPPASIKGAEHLGAYAGFAPKSVGAVCDSVDVTEVVEAPSAVLDPRNGMVTVDLIEPGAGAQPLDPPLSSSPMLRRTADALDTLLVLTLMVVSLIFVVLIWD